MNHDMSDFFTREKANSGIKVPLTLPNGEASEHYIIIRGIDSDEFRSAEARHVRDAVEIAQIKDVIARGAAIDDAKRRLVATLVAGWSFDKECNEDNILEFFRNAPQIMDTVNKIAGKRSLFFALESAASNNTLKMNTDSTKNQEDQK